jgi:ketol-acid reductoisomerase
MQIRKDITVIMCAPTWIRSSWGIQGFGVPTLIAVHPENNPNGAGFEQAKRMQ